MTISSNRRNQLSLSQNIKDNQFINKNLSETFNLKETSETKHPIADNRELKAISNSTDSQNQAITNPSSPTPCNALWDNISNEKLLSLCKNHRRTHIHFSKEINQNDYNQNYHSATTLFEFITRQQYLKEQQALNEHILYIKRTKNSKK